MVNEKKIILVGDVGVGKISLIFNYFVDRLPDPAVPNIYKEYHTEVEVDGQKVPIELWIVPAQDCYSQIRTLSYEKTDAVLLCYAINDNNSLTNATDKWLPEIREHLPNVGVVLVGNKTDLRVQEDAAEADMNSSQPLSSESGQQAATLHNVNDFIECSAKNGDNVKEVFKVAVRAALKSGS